MSENTINVKNVSKNVRGKKKKKLILQTFQPYNMGPKIRQVSLKLVLFKKNGESN